MTLSNDSGGHFYDFENETQPTFTRPKVNRNTKTRCEIYSKLTVKTPDRRHWHASGVIIVNFKHISHLLLTFLLFTVNM